MKKLLMNWVLLLGLSLFVMLTAHAEPPSVNVQSQLPASLALDNEAIDAVQACIGKKSDFAQRYKSLVADDQALQQQATDSEKFKAAIEKSQLNLKQEENALNIFATSQTKMGSDLDMRRKSLYRNHATKPLNQDELQQENAKIQAYNAMSGEFNVVTDQYNKLVLAQKKRIADHNNLVAKLNTVVARYNSDALAVQGALNKILADVGFYQHKCAAPGK